MADMVPVLLGTAGMVQGECFILSDGTDMVIGRSRGCDISLRRSPTYLKSPSEVRDTDHDFNTVSRRHVRLQVHDSVIRVQDLSTNGTYCNDEPINQSREVDLTGGPCTLRLGTRESFQMVMLAKDDPRVRQPPHPTTSGSNGSSGVDTEGHPQGSAGGKHVTPPDGIGDDHTTSPDLPIDPPRGSGSRPST